MENTVKHGSNNCKIAMTRAIIIFPFTCFNKLKTMKCINDIFSELFTELCDIYLTLAPSRPCDCGSGAALGVWFWPLKYVCSTLATWAQHLEQTRTMTCTTQHLIQLWELSTISLVQVWSILSKIRELCDSSNGIWYHM